MGQTLHGCATTTHTIRKAIQDSADPLDKLAKKYALDPKTVAKWKHRDYVHDTPMGPKNPHSTSLTAEQEAAVVTFRKHTLLPLDDCLYALKDAIPQLTRSNLHRCLQRHGVSKIPKEKALETSKKTFKAYPIGYFHVDIASVRTEEGRLYLFVAIDRTSKFVYVELHDNMRVDTTIVFLTNLFPAVPYKIHTILTDNGIQFTNRKKDTCAFDHPFDRLCASKSIEHRLTKPAHPWTNGQVERMNGIIKEATVKRYYYDNHETLRKHLHSFITAYNHGKRLKALKGLAPYEFIIQLWEKEPDKFNENPHRHIVGRNG